MVLLRAETPSQTTQGPHPDWQHAMLDALSHREGWSVSRSEVRYAHNKLEKHPVIFLKHIFNVLFRLSRLVLALGRLSVCLSHRRMLGKQCGSLNQLGIKDLLST
jgi:hypothetical protein